MLLHRAEADLSDEQRETLAKIRRNDAALLGKKVLVIDDDLRNIFALTSVLEQHELQVLHAENGRAGIEILRNTPDVDAVLMDIMMPEMDGYETTRAIRQIPEFRSLPIVALTAKAMKGDREKCLQAGASDYVTKPVIWIICFPCFVSGFLATMNGRSPSPRMPLVSAQRRRKTYVSETPSVAHAQCRPDKHLRAGSQTCGSRATLGIRFGTTTVGEWPTRILASAPLLAERTCRSLTRRTREPIRNCTPSARALHDSPQLAITKQSCAY